MNLYFLPGACSFAPNVLMNEMGIKFNPIKVDRQKKTSDGRNFLDINPKGYVPVLELDNGKRLTEGVAVLQYLADQKPDMGFAPKLGTWERYELMEMMNYITSEVHKNYNTLFNRKNLVASSEGETQLTENVKKTLARRLEFLVPKLEKHPYLMGDKMTIADVYLFTCLRWSEMVGFDLKPFPSITDFMGRMNERPSVKAATEIEFGPAH